MLIVVGFDCYAKILQCDNSNLPKLPVLLKKLDEWLYEESQEETGCFCVKKSLNVEYLDISVVLRFFNENYPNCNAKVVDEYVAIENINDKLPIISL